MERARSRLPECHDRRLSVMMIDLYQPEADQRPARTPLKGWSAGASAARQLQRERFARRTFVRDRWRHGFRSRDAGDQHRASAGQARRRCAARTCVPGWAFMST